MGIEWHNETVFKESKFTTDPNWIVDMIEEIVDMIEEEYNPKEASMAEI